MVAFPLDDRYELLLNGEWTDITGWVYERDPVSITRGRSAEADSADPSKLTLTLDNRDGRFSPRNPMSPYYGNLGRNTQIRASLPGPARLDLPDTGTGYASAPDSAGLSITGDLDVRIEADLDDWTADGDLIGKAQTTGGQISWGLFTRSDGDLQLFWSANGSATVSARSTVPVPVPGRGHMAVRVTLDVDNGASGWTARFYLSSSIDGPWAQLGDDVTGSAATSIFDSTAPVQIGRIPNFTFSGHSGRVFAAEIRDGIDGTLVASPDFTAQTAGAASFADDQANTWTVNSPAALLDRVYRFYGEVASWPATWNLSGADAYVKITAAGITRRLTQNVSPLRSTMFRAHTSPALTSIKAYWPCEDGAEATAIASGLPGAPPMTIEGSPTLADYSGWTASDAMPQMASGRFTGRVPLYTTSSDEAMVYMFVFVDEPPAAETSLLKVVTTGTARIWEVRLLPNGSLRTKAWDDLGAAIDDGAQVLDDEATQFNLDSRGFVMLALQFVQLGADMNWAVAVNDFGNTDSIGGSLDTVISSGSLTGKTFGRIERVTIGAQQGIGNTKISHITVTDTTLTWLTDVADAIRAFNGEAPVTRIARLLDEEGIGFTTVTGGRTDSVVTMGDQTIKTLVELLEQAAESDGGILYEPREFLGFANRTRASMYNQAAGVTLDYSAAQIMGDLVPVDDDRETVNDFTVKRDAGSSVRVEETSGPLSTQAPPDGVGRYNAEITLSLEDDGQLPDQAGWRLHLGTVDEARFPTLTVNLRAPGITDTLAERVLDLDVGDRIVLTGIPDGLPPDDVSMLVQGYTETLRLYEYEITFNLAPESPWHVGQADTDGFDRLDSAGGSTLTESVGAQTPLYPGGDVFPGEDVYPAAASTLSVASTGALWTTHADDMPFDVMAGGERMTVTAVSGTSSPQTFTVTRSVNGVEKAHPSGTAVTIAEPVYVAL